MREVRTKPSETCFDRLSGFGMQSDFPRQREELERLIEVNRVRRKGLRNACARWLLFAVRFAELHIGPEAAGLEAHRFARLRIISEHARRGFTFVSRPAQLARIAAFGIIRASDEGAEPAELQIQAAVVAARTEPGIA